jgi:threonine synthase
LYATELRCISCDQPFPIGALGECPTCGGILDVEYDYERMFADVDVEAALRRREGVWGFRELLPARERDVSVSMGEGDTPLLCASRLGESYGIENLYIKDDSQNPTGSFKDRPITVSVAMTKELGQEAVIVASSGNNAASASAYTARAGLPCVVCVPEGTPVGKMGQMVAHGARVLRMQGDFAGVHRLVKEAAKELNYFNVTSTFLNPFGPEGDKTAAYEIFTQLEFQVPEWIVVPIGAGPFLVGILKGFQEMMLAGLADRLPAMVGAQAEGCAPVVQAFDNDWDEVRPWRDEPRTVASGIADALTTYPQDGTYTLEAIRRSVGVALAASDEEILRAQQDMARLEGVFPEPSGAVGAAVLPGLTEKGRVRPGDRVVVLATGHGLKDAQAALHDAGEPPSIPPTVQALLRALG